MQRNKGANYEREVVHTINAKFPEEFHAKRRLGQARDGGHDITWPATNFVLECKRRARQAAVQAWLTQAEEACISGEQVPLVVHRGDGGRSVAVLYFDDLLNIVYKLYGLAVTPDLQELLGDLPDESKQDPA